MNLRIFCILISCISVFALTSCDTHEGTVDSFVYYWKGIFHLDEMQEEYLKNAGINNIYLHYFDVDWDFQKNQAYPRTSVQIASRDSLKFTIIPVIYITNRTFRNISDSALNTLAINIKNKIDQMSQRFIQRGIREIQIDCDWSESSREKYFTFLEYFKQVNTGKIVSATIRLHQIKYFTRTGVPPVDKGMLMYYNMIPFEEIKKRNSIYDEEIAEKYLVNFDQYPLHLDCVLPAYESVLHYKGKNGISLINADSWSTYFEDNEYQASGKNCFVAKRNQQFKGFKIKKGDTLRVDQILPSKCRTASRQIAPFIKKSDTLQVGFYHLDKFLIENYEREDMESILRYFR